MSSKKQSKASNMVQVMPVVSDPEMRNPKGQAEIMLGKELGVDTELEDKVFGDSTVKTKEEVEAQAKVSDVDVESSSNTFIIGIFIIVILVLVAIIVWMVMRSNTARRHEELEMKQRIMPPIHVNNMPNLIPPQHYGQQMAQQHMLQQAQQQTQQQTQQQQVQQHTQQLQSPTQLMTQPTQQSNQQPNTTNSSGKNVHFGQDMTVYSFGSKRNVDGKNQEANIVDDVANVNDTAVDNADDTTVDNINDTNVEDANDTNTLMLNMDSDDSDEEIHTVNADNLSNQQQQLQQSLLKFSGGTRRVAQSEVDDIMQQTKLALEELE